MPDTTKMQISATLSSTIFPALLNRTFNTYWRTISLGQKKALGTLLLLSEGLVLSEEQATRLGSILSRSDFPTEAFIKLFDSQETKVTDAALKSFYLLPPQNIQHRFVELL